MAFRRFLHGSNSSGPEPVTGAGGPHEIRRDERTTRMATGTLACPSCDAPVLLTAPAMGPSDPLSCAFCGHEGALRDFLSLAEPTRPTRVEVHVRLGVPQIRAARRGDG
jgi:hypothetical protein